MGGLPQLGGEEEAGTLLRPLQEASALGLWQQGPLKLHCLASPKLGCQGVEKVSSQKEIRIRVITD